MSKETIFTPEEQAVYETYQTMQQAMIHKDMETLDRVVSDSAKFVHMSGKTQTKAEYFGEIADGTLNYYKSEIKNIQIEITGDTAVLRGRAKLTAKVYGISGSWPFQTNSWFRKEDGQWRFIGRP